MADGFLGRWSQRKQALREGRAVSELPTPTAPVTDADLSAAAVQQSVTAVAGEAGRGPRPGLAPDGVALQPGAGAAVTQKPALAPVPAPTLEDVKALNADSSFAPFVSRDVAPDVRNAAMKKLFTDPHYNVMDGLDIYIDDYAKPDPMPAAMLRQMASAKFLKLFDEEPDQAPASTSTSATPIEDTPHDHTDLRLQPDDAARPEGLEREPERTPDAAFQPVPPGSR
ncbi:MAG: DUF3306 domain-containing protein [Rhodoferax sp.]|nr:DUF3306 domain-containing protein [Rhodoferax sp.]